MLAKFPKIKAGLQDCYFEKDLKRIFIGEAYKPLYKTLAKERSVCLISILTNEVPLM